LHFQRAQSVFLFVLVLSLGCTDRLAAEESHQRSNLAEIQALIRARQYDEALARTGADLRNSPADYRLWTIRGIALSLKGDTSRAVASFDKALSISPSYPPALKGETEILFRSADQRAIPLLEKILKTDPRDLTAHEMLATLERKNGDCAAASEHFRAAADAINTHPQSLEAYGYCLLETAQPEKAVPVFEQLVTLLSDRSYAKYDLAVVQVASKQYEAATKTLEPMLTEDQKDPEILSLASQAYEGTKNTPRAVALLRQAIVLSPRTPGYYAAFASLCLEHDSFQVGVDMLNVGLKNIPDDPSLYLSRGLLYVELAQFEKAEADFSRVEKLSSFQAIGSYALALAEMQKNDPELALSNVRAQLKTHPDDPLLNYFLARSLMNQSPDVQSDEFKQAMRAALKSEKARPDYAPAHDLLAAIYIQAGDYSRAVEECRTALRYDPSDETATYHLLMALKHTGHTEDLAALSRRLAELHRESLQHENQRKSFRLIEGDPAGPAPTGAEKQAP
jgi:tetratricopeptide (TPR) repeat protein